MMMISDVVYMLCVLLNLQSGDKRSKKAQPMSTFDAIIVPPLVHPQQ